MMPGRLFLLLSALALAACGSNVDETLTARTFQVVGQTVTGAAARKAAPKPLALTRADLARLPFPADLATVEATGADAVIFEIGQNGDTETWSSVDDKTLAIRDGQIVGTRGLRGDLVAALVPPLSRIAAGSGSHNRMLVTIGDNERTRRTGYACEMSVVGNQTVTLVGRSYATRHVRETCAGKLADFTNDYWFQGSTLRQSRQWMGADLGYIRLSRLRD